MRLSATTFIVLASALLLTGFKTDAGDSADLKCEQPYTVPGTNSWNAIQCYFEGEPYTDTGKFPVQLIYPVPLPKDHSLRLNVIMHGYGGYPAYCTDPHVGPPPGHITIGNCSDMENSTGSFWGPLGGVNRAGYRIAVSLNKAVELFGDSIDQGAGPILAGASMGGTGNILQAMILPDKLWRNKISVVDSAVGSLLFTEPDGYYWHDPFIAKSWAGYDISKLNVKAAMARGDLRGVYFKAIGNTNDPLGFDIDFFRYCDTYRIACFAMWGLYEHNPYCEPGVNMPCSARFSDPRSDVRRDKVLPVFTNSSANHWGPRGHHNLGLGWDAAAIVDSADALAVPIRYGRFTGIGGGIPDQPASVTFDLTLRRPQAFALKKGSSIAWTLGGKSGIAKVTVDGEVTIPGLTLPSADTYSAITLRPAAGGIHAARPPGCGGPGLKNPNAAPVGAKESKPGSA